MTIKVGSNVALSDTALGVGTASPAASAGIELSGVTKAVLVSRMTTTERDALTAVNGMVIYNSTTNKLQKYENSAWNDIGAGGATTFDAIGTGTNITAAMWVDTGATFRCTSDTFSLLVGNDTLTFALQAVGGAAAGTLTFPPVTGNALVDTNGGTLTGDFIFDPTFRVVEGSNKSMGVATLVGGTVTVSNTFVEANSRIFLSGQNSSGTHGELTISARTANTSFVITSSSGTDTRDVAWLIIQPA